MSGLDASNYELRVTQHLLLILGEECAEVAQAVSKAIRFGLDEVQPGNPPSNKEKLEHELGQLLAMVDMLKLTPCEESRRKKPDAVWKYMGYSAELGQL